MGALKIVGHASLVGLCALVGVLGWACSSNANERAEDAGASAAPRASASAAVVASAGEPAASAPPPTATATGHGLASEHVDRIEVFKAAHRMDAYAGDRLLKTYSVALGSAGAGPKRYEGDHHTPEGRYTIVDRRRSDEFHYFLELSYPN